MTSPSTSTPTPGEEVPAALPAPDQGPAEDAVESAVEDAAPPPPEEQRPTRTGRSIRLWRLAGAAGEAVAALGAAALSVQLSRSVVVDPLDRTGQVSGLAALDLRFLLLGLLVVGAAVVAARVGPRTWAVVSRCACAAVAGLATGLIAGGIVVALRGTAWPLFANSGDSAQLVIWADNLLAGRPIPPNYPPAVIHAIAGLAELTGGSSSSGLRTVHIAGTALFGPVAYLSWRLVVPPAWALAVTLVAAVPLLEPYKPYTTVVLVALVPVLIALAASVRRAAALSWPHLVAIGAGAGVALGVLFCVYSGWFVWSAPGALVAMLVVFPWRAGAGRALALLGLTAAGLVAVAAPHLFGLLTASSTVQDRYFYFDTFVDPAYIAMWRNDLPGETGPWPPPGELGGVGLFTVVLVVGLGVAVALGARRSSIVVVGSLVAGAWLLRFFFASQMYATGTVQLYPRTTHEILFCLLVLTVLAARLAVHRLAVLVDRWAPAVDDAAPPRGARSTRPATAVGVLCAALLLALSMGSSVADRHMPRDDDSVGLLAYVAQMVRQPDGTCPEYSRAPDRCAVGAVELLGRDDG